MRKLKKGIHIAIITKGRIHKQKTLDRLPDSVRKRVTLYCHPGEESELNSIWGDKVRAIVPCPKDCKYVGQIREWLAYTAPKGKIIFCDDDVFFGVKQKGYTTPRTLSEKNFTSDELEQHHINIFNFMWSELFKDEVAVSSVSYRPYNRTNESIKKNTRFFGVWGLDCKKYYQQNKYLMSDWFIKQDMIVGIVCMMMGYNIHINNQYCFDVRQANIEGGCSTYRTVEMLNEFSLKMVKEFPEFVSIKNRKAGVWAGDFKDKESIDVTVHWSKIPKSMKIT